MQQKAYQRFNNTKAIRKIIEMIMITFRNPGEFANPKGIGPIKPPNPNLTFTPEFDIKEITIKNIPITRNINPKTYKYSIVLIFFYSTTTGNLFETPFTNFFNSSISSSIL